MKNMNIRSVKYRFRDRGDSLIKDVELVKKYHGSTSVRTEKIGHIFKNPKTNVDKHHNRTVEGDAKALVRAIAKEVESTEKVFKGRPLSFTQFLIDEVETHPKVKQPLSYYRQFLAQRGLPEVTKWSDVTQNHLLDFQKFLNKEALKKDGTRLSGHTAISYFDRILGRISKAVHDGFLNKKPIPSNLINRNYPDTIKEYLELDEVYRLHKYEVKTEKERLIRDSFIFACHTGLRPSDVMGLKKEQLSPNLKGMNSGVHNMFKTKKNVGVYITDEIIELTNFYLNKNPESEYLFPKLSYSNNLNKSLQALASKVGVNDKITFGSGRHSFVNIQLAHGVSPATISFWLGHKSLKSVLSYLNRNNHEFNQLRNQALNYGKLRGGLAS